MTSIVFVIKNYTFKNVLRSLFVNSFDSISCNIIILSDDENLQTKVHLQSRKANLSIRQG